MAFTWGNVFLLAFGALPTLSHAQSCWRSTNCTGPDEPAFPGVWDSSIYAPRSRFVVPSYVLSLDGTLGTEYAGSITLKNNGSSVVLDFGVEVGGIISFNYSTTSPGALGLAFTESKTWIGEWSDSSNGGFRGPDGAIYANMTTAGSGAYQMPDRKLRGGFRYLTMFLITANNTTVEVSNISLEIAFQPTWSNLRAYQGYFHSNDELLNRIWYSGAYTLQTNCVPTNTGRHMPAPGSGWLNDGQLGPGTTIMVDGAKRDRAVWPGDMGIAVPSTFVSTGDLDSIKNALQVMYDYQNSDGSLPEAGPPLLQQGSDTYHMWTMIGTYNYVLYSNDTAFLEKNWPKYLKSLDYIYAKVNSNGLLNVTGIRDWARWVQGNENSQANMILYRTLETGSALAAWVGDQTNLSITLLERASILKEAINRLLWDDTYGAFKDNSTTTDLHPQDANSMAILFNVTSLSRAQKISERLLFNWTPIGAVAPELPKNISPFISSFEVQAHFTVGETARALELIRTSWGWYLNHPNGTGSTVIEGYLEDGTFGYRYDRGYHRDPSYISHAHGWSSGPTSALTEYVLGLSVTQRAGQTWSLRPQFGDLKKVEGGFSTVLGKFRAEWRILQQGYIVRIDVPKNTRGLAVLPYVIGRDSQVVSVDGGKDQVVRSGDDGGISLELQGGRHTIRVR